MIKLKTRETRTLVAVHGWAGALLGLLLYAVIVTGTAAGFAEKRIEVSSRRATRNQRTGSLGR